MKWKLNQVFGEDPSAVNEENIITSVRFDPHGDFLAIGYQCGQVVVFKNTTGDTFKFYAQFESHHPEFDFLTSLEIEERINKIRWLKQKYDGTRMMLTSNDKTIKLWKLSERKKRGEAENNGMPKTQAKRVFGNAHAYNINSVSLCSDGETFISADDLRVNLWSLEDNKESFTCIDIKPTNMSELSEVITSATFHPFLCNQFIYSSSKGVVYQADMRTNALCESNLRCFKESNPSGKSFFSEVTSSMSDVQYSPDGRYIMARDYLNLKIWDVNNDSSPLAIYNVHDHIKPKLYELYENDIIFDKFECCWSPDSKSVMTGTYSNGFVIFDVASGEPTHMQAVNPRDKRKRRNATLPVTEDINFDEKVSHITWSSKSDLLACAAGNYIYLYVGNN
eukprot:TRINITY_DN2045_c0_g1_i1.p1 TRINITY_DN2045_c0_g1~~TRINITY_DN2045_c0_g1_i1.p1  ORF type:complete len:393 (-),score=124.31 TRINITY_DN2045_c0_g1_i1:143-1321(-)